MPGSPQASTEVEERELARIAAYFAPPPFEKLPRWSAAFEEASWRSRPSHAGPRNNLAAHQVDGYTIVNISLKPEGGIPGDATGDQMRLMARSRRALLLTTSYASAMRRTSCCRM